MCRRFVKPAGERGRSTNLRVRVTGVPEASLEQTEVGLAATGDGWFVLNARDAIWRERPGRGYLCDFEARTDFPQLGINLTRLEPGEPMSMYHWENDQEDFLVLSGEALAIVEGEERPLRQWDFLHCPVGAKHTIVGAGDGPCLILCVGSRTTQNDEESWGGYTVDEAALRHNAGVEQETNRPREAYARFPDSRQIRYREGLLPE